MGRQIHPPLEPALQNLDDAERKDSESGSLTDSAGTDFGSDYVVKARLMDEHDLGRTLDRLARQIVEQLDPDSDEDHFAIIGMQSRGVFLARRLQERISRFESIDMPLGVLDATMYRDDFRLRASQPAVRATDIPFDVTGKHIFLVDDVLYTGRTIRAALDALMDTGRPASVRCLALIDRGHHELPIQADIVGRVVPTVPGEEVRVRLQECDGAEGVWLVQRNDDEPKGP